MGGVSESMLPRKIFPQYAFRMAENKLDFKSCYWSKIKLLENVKHNDNDSNLTQI